MQKNIDFFFVWWIVIDSEEEEETLWIAWILFIKKNRYFLYPMWYPHQRSESSICVNFMQFCIIVSLYIQFKRRRRKWLILSKLLTAVMVLIIIIIINTEIWSQICRSTHTHIKIITTPIVICFKKIILRTTQIKLIWKKYCYY